MSKPKPLVEWPRCDIPDDIAIYFRSPGGGKWSVSAVMDCKDFVNFTIKLPDEDETEIRVRQAQVWWNEDDQDWSESHESSHFGGVGYTQRCNATRVNMKEVPDEQA